MVTEVVARFGVSVRHAAGHISSVPFPLPPDPPIAAGRPLRRLLRETTRAIARFDACPRAGTDEDTRVQRAAELLVRGVVRDGWTVDLLRVAHAEIVRDGRGGDRRPGTIRRRQNWVGPSLEEASYVPPPGWALPRLLRDLMAFLTAARDVDPVVVAALAHAQVVSIHAFNDGNGRLARAVALAVLCLGGAPSRLPLNQILTARRAEPDTAIRAIQHRGDWEEWVTFFAGALNEGARA